MKQLAVAFLFVAAWALPFAPVVATAPSEPDVEVEAIINKALERQPGHRNRISKPASATR